jgi:hypothetical protein
MEAVERLRPTEMTRESFCELALARANELHLSTVQQCAKFTQVATTFWIKIRRKSLPDYAHASKRSINGAAASITRICEKLGLDIESCLEACGLPYDYSVVAGAVNSLHCECFTEENLKRLLALVQLTGGPVPISFGLQFLSIGRVEG